LLDVQVERNAAALTGKADEGHVEQLKVDIKASLADQATRIADKAEHSALAVMRDASQLEFQTLKRQVAATASGLTALDTRVRI
jgi:hypothetical protein